MRSYAVARLVRLSTRNAEVSTTSSSVPESVTTLCCMLLVAYFHFNT